MRKEQDNRRKQLILALFIAVIMVSSTAGFIWDSSGSGFKYNGFSFKSTDQKGISTKANGHEVWFSYRPSDTEDLEMSPEAISKLKSTKMIYTTSNMTSKNKGIIAEIQYDLDQLMREQFDVYIVTGFTTDTEEHPLLSCANATEFIPVISFEDAEGNSSIEYSENCLKINADSEFEFIRARDRMVYGLLGIVN